MSFALSISVCIFFAFGAITCQILLAEAAGKKELDMHKKSSKVAIAEKQ